MARASRSDVVTGLAIALAFIVGAVSGRGTSSAPAELRERTEQLSSCTTELEKAQKQTEQQQEKKPQPVFSAPSAPPPPPPPSASAEERAVYLEGEVKRLTLQLQAKTQEQHEADGAPIAFPEGKTAQQEEQKLLATLRASLSAQGLSGDIQAVDCGEFPCIAHGTIQGVHDAEMQAVIDEAKAKLGGLPYAGISRFVNDKDPSKSKTTFSLSLYPEGLPQEEQDNMNKRLRSRKNAYVDASSHD